MFYAYFSMFQGCFLYVKWIGDECVQCQGYFGGYFLGIQGCFYVVLEVCFNGISRLFQRFFRFFLKAF